jgi:hypothetical protein
MQWSAEAAKAGLIPPGETPEPRESLVAAP